MAQDKGGTSSCRVASQFGIQQKSAWAMLHKLRAAMRDAGRIFAEVCPAATSANIKSLVEFATVAGEKHSFKADGWHAHHVLRRMGHDSDVKAAPGILGIGKLPWLHTFISLLRRYTYHGVRPYLLQLYLDEFTFRANRRFGQSRIWQSLIRACCHAKPFKIADLNG